MAEPDINTKHCPRCGVDKPHAEFGRRKVAKDGLYRWCKPCCADSCLEYRTANHDRVAAKQREWRLANPEKKIATARAWNIANKEKIASEQHGRYLANKEKTASDDQAFEAYRKKKAAVSRAYRRTHKENVAAYNRAYGLANPKRMAAHWRNRRARKRDAGGTHTAADIDLLMKLQKGKCAHSWCRKSLRAGRHVDHIIPLKLDGRNDRHNLQLLCCVCNLSKNAAHPIDFAQRHGLLL